ncbi:hypothetical protein [Aequorivita antarctica]|uniref:Lipoprotein n=1 Tax=Aequorivita antarctica TaxID=153266 RepID=A0A5C6YVG7_9FLAO|nr:hypothetical protein [Aequorivita antarctica]TXD71614.1 hypothetical protein ESU54_15895 [Aequorivita antarctica]SRX75930.1 hypothetical protein AEQU3_02928 [Aequorivita antarctica]
MLSTFKYSLTILSIALWLACKNSTENKTISSQKNNQITCTDITCQETYTGPEFTNGSDVAHQFSNKMSEKVGEQLKQLYNEEKYSKVDFQNIKMSTKGMGSGMVEYSLYIPFKSVEEPCKAYTSFDHVGGWNHTPALASRKAQLTTLLLEGESLEISELKTTPEGLQEYWIQWKSKELQSDCIQK